ncbi:polymer-forming cytoskeletal protein [Sphingomonas sp. BGYR3]|uniref:bactofilin family protein n=1 Tax=Sphingomonas sp. BGYR3 TaxID=2975483 RepID=UPI0021A4E74F|nr:polymer-forming cytoskeletal protein [Sphingomonas sp. BGYR3]MDG5489621.1 polymer-forming cytoskeletal protein [Sphingomonas sp. BGYR3]
MFNSNRNRDDRSPAHPPAPSAAPGAPANQQAGRKGMFSVIGADIVIIGNVSASNDLHIDGRVEGDITCTSLIQGPESRIGGLITADTARLAGTVDGTVRVKNLTIDRTARINGDVEYDQITIETGGHIDGRLKHMAVIAEQVAKAGLDPADAPIAPVTIVSDTAE